MYRKHHNQHKHDKQDKNIGGYRHIFGPVPSRRLGMSLGVDLMPHKTCTFDCVYCESGATTCSTMKQDEYVPLNLIKTELEAFLSGSPKLDFITFSGSGEPTLHSGIGEIIRFLKSAYPQYKIAILTNGALLFKPHVRRQILNADLVKVSLDAASEEVFIHINRPCPGLELSHIIDGLIDFRKEFAKKFWVELFIVPGVNDKRAELLKIKKILALLKPDKIQLNTLDRPGTESWVTAVNKGSMENIASFFYDAEIIKYFNTVQNNSVHDGNLPERLLSTIRRRPCTAEDVARSLGIQVDEVCKHLDAFVENGKIKKKDMPRGIFYLTRT